jgi:hypothetical protein
MYFVFLDFVVQHFELLADGSFGANQRPDHPGIAR